MTVELTSPALGLEVGDTYTGPEEAWLLAEGYAKQDGYTGPGVSNTGPTDVEPDEDPGLAENREEPPARNDDGTVEAGGPDYDFDIGGIDTEAPDADFALEPAEGPAAGGTEVTLVGQNLEGVTGVTVDGVAATDVAVVSDSEVTFVTPAGTAGPADVAVTDDVGTTTETAAFTYTA